MSKVIINSVDTASKTAIVSVGDRHFRSRIVFGTKSGDEDKIFVDISGVHCLLSSEEEHKRWITIPRTGFDSGEFETAKQKRLPTTISLTNIYDYLDENEQKCLKGLVKKAQDKLDALNTKKVSDDLLTKQKDALKSLLQGLTPEQLAELMKN